MRFSIEKVQEQINKEIKDFSFGEEPENLYEPIRYIMSLGGKRLRPLLTLLSYNLFSDDYKQMLLPAIGVEVFHNFTLMHDDIMDNAPLRRGKPTVHEKWNQNVAILSGDVMLVKSYELLLNAEESNYREILQAFNNCAAAVCEGQQLDVNYETRENIELDEYIRMITLKTAKLLSFCMELGGIAADADKKNLEFLKSFGINIGIAFQLQDDLLDIYGDNEKFGKKTAGDIHARKKTFLLIKALELAKGKDQEAIKNFITSTGPVGEEQVSTIKRIYDGVGVKKITQVAVEEYFKKALSNLSGIDAPLYKKKILKDFVSKLMLRES